MKLKGGRTMVTMDIPVEAKVHCVDGPGGESTQVIIYPTTNKVTHVVVKERQAPHTERLVPLRSVVETADDLIRLRCTRRELSGMRAFILTEFVRAEIPGYEDISGYILHPYVVPQWVQVEHESIPPGELGVRRGARVRATDGNIGRVDEFVVDPDSGHITHLVLREGLPWDQEEVTIPITEIDRIEEKAVYLKLDKDGVEALPAVAVRRGWL
jgi:sporulation protein YlmC with PRC-barrel domain